MKFYKIFFALLLVKLCVAQEKNCNMTVEDADHCAKQLMFIGDRDNLIPANDGEMQSYCDRMKSGIRCIRHFAKNCLPPFPQQVFGMFAYDSKSLLRRQCKQQKDRSEFIKHVSCFLPKPYMEPLHLCMDRYILQLDIIKANIPDWRIPGMCCAFHLFEKCIHDNTQTLCEAKTGVDTTDFMMNIINSITDDVLDFTCGQFESIERCDKHLDPELWTKLKEDKSAETIVSERAHQKFYSPVPGLVSVIANYEM